MCVRRLSIALAGVIAGAVAASAAQAQMTDAYTFKNLGYSQTGANGSVITFQDAFFNAGFDMTNTGDFTSGALTYPGPASPDTLSQTGPTSFSEGPGFATQAAMDAAYPKGNYLVTGSGGTQGTVTQTLSYTADGYAGNVAALAGSSYDALQGVTTTLHSLTLNFNAQTPSPLATTSLTFFTIFNTNQSCGGLSPSATSCTIDPHDLKPGATYDYEIDFSNRIENTNAGVLDGVDFDVRTDGSFTTAAAIPEPGAWAMMLLGFGALGAGLRMRRRGILSAV